MVRGREGGSCRGERREWLEVGRVAVEERGGGNGWRYGGGGVIFILL